MAIALPILVTVFPLDSAYLLPALAFLIALMKGASLGGAVPAILFNTPGTPDAVLTTLDGYPLAQQGNARQALRIAHVSSASGDTFSDLVLIISAPFLAFWIEAWLDLPEKAALILLSLSCIAVLLDKSIWKGLLAGLFGLLTSSIGTGADLLVPRMTFGLPQFNNPDGLPVSVVILGILILGEVFVALEQEIHEGARKTAVQRPRQRTEGQRLTHRLLRRIFPSIGISALIGTGIGALPGVGSTLAATLGHMTAQGRKPREGEAPYGAGNPNGLAATEAANSAVSGANMIPVLSLGIPGNAAAVFILLAFESFGGLSPGPSVFRGGLGVTEIGAGGSDLTFVVGLFVLMMLANLCNWTFGGAFMRIIGAVSAVPRHVLLPLVLVITLASIYIEQPDGLWLIVVLIFSVLGYLMRKVDMPVLPFVIAFILARGDNGLEKMFGKALGVTKDPWFLFDSWTSTIFVILAIALPLLIALNRLCIWKYSPSLLPRI